MLFIYLFIYSYITKFILSTSKHGISLDGSRLYTRFEGNQGSEVRLLRHAIMHRLYTIKYI